MAQKRAASPRAKVSPRVVAARENGKRGGLACAQKHGQEFCQARGEKGGRATRDLYGRDYFAHIRNLRTDHNGYPKGRPRKKIAEVSHAADSATMPYLSRWADNSSSSA